MKIKLSSSKPKLEAQRKCNSSVEKIKIKKKANNPPNPEPPFISLKSAIFEKAHPKFIAIASQHS